MSHEEFNFDEAFECVLDIVLRLKTWQDVYAEYREWCDRVGEVRAFRLFMAVHEHIGSLKTEHASIDNVIQFPVRHRI